MKLLKRLGFAALFTLLVFVTAEAGLRLARRIGTSEQNRLETRYSDRIKARLYRGWMKTDEKDPFRPPFLVYSDRDSNDPERLRKIFETTRLPPSRTWASSDFLQAEERAGLTSFTVHSNSLGFRGREYPVEKKPGTYRIIALGDYHVFGHGVEDDDSYPAQLEKLLDAKAGRGNRRFEVWNGGRNAATAIVGLARMKHEIFDFHPDLITIDYGMVDTLVFADNMMPAVARFPDSGAVMALRKLIEPFASLLAGSLIVQRLLEAKSSKQFSERVEEFRQVLTAIVALAREKRIPLVLIQQMHARQNPSVFRSFTGDLVSYVNVGEVFSARPPESLETTDQWKNFPWQKTWIAEMEEGSRPEEWKMLRPRRFARYYLDVFQLNQIGHRILADGLVAPVLKALKLEKPR